MEEKKKGQHSKITHKAPKNSVEYSGTKVSCQKCHAKRALENIRNENKHDIEVHLDEILKLKRLNHQMERRIKSLRNEIEVVKEESIMQRNEDRDAIVEMKKTLSSSNDNVVMLQEKLSHEARMNQIRSDEVDKWKTLYNAEVSEALKAKRILQNKCDALMKQLRYSDNVIDEKANQLEDNKRMVHFLNMSINTLNTEIDALSMQINGAEDDFFKLLNEYLKKL